MWTYLSFGILLGLSSGVSPGPLLTLVISQTLRHGAGEGIRVAAAPLITDLPILLAGVMAFSFLPDPDAFLGVLSFVGSAFVLFLGVSGLRAQTVEARSPSPAPRSCLKGALVNALNPHPYLFWFSVGVPTVLKAMQQSALGAVGFVSAFFACLVGAKVFIALLVGKSQRFLEGAVYRWIMRSLAVMLIGFSMVLFRDGLRLLGWIS